MFQSAGYPAHPTRFSAYDYPRTPQRSGSNAYYSPRQYSYSATPPRGHVRRSTGDAATFTFVNPSYSTPRKGAYYAAPEYSSPGYYQSAQSTPLRKTDYVSNSERKRDSPRADRVPAYGSGKQQRQHSRTYVVLDETSDFEYEYESLPRYEPFDARPPPPYRRSQSYFEAGTDRYYHDQVPIFSPAEPAEKTRPRRASHTTRPAQPTTPRRPPPTATKTPPKATEADARHHRIPAGYSLKNWDPTEEPILLLGSVFDANSLGKWIYDWTVFYHGPASPMAEVAGELWLLLIQLAGKIKRAEECYARIRRPAARDLVDDFLESGQRLWERLGKLIKLCEGFMYQAARRESGATKSKSSSKEKVTMGRNSGCEFVDSIFGRDRELERTEKLMTGMRLWSMRFDANCEDILRNPSA